MTVTLFVVAGVLALADWGAVAQRRFRLEYLFKPLTLVALIAATSSAHLGAAQPWVTIGLALGLVGDIALLVADDAGDPDPSFLLGLGAFLVAHVFYVVAFLRVGVRTLDVVAGLLVAGGIAGLTLPPVLRGARRIGGGRLRLVVAGYAAVLAVMAALAAGTGIAATAVGGLLFLGSDTLIARERFVGPVRRGPLLVISTYHLAQFLIVLGLIGAA